MKKVTIQYAKQPVKFSTAELQLSKQLEVVVNEANNLITSSANMQLDCPIKKITDMQWDIMRCVKYHAEVHNKGKAMFSLDMDDDELTILQAGKPFAVIKEKE